MAVTNLTDESASPVTQIFYLSIPVEHPLEDATSGAGCRWAEVLELIAESPGFLRLYWGRQVEESKKVQLHIVRETLEQNEDFLESALYLDEVLPLIKSLLTPPHPVHPTIPDIQIWHVHLGQQLAAAAATTTSNAAAAATTARGFGLGSLLGYPVSTALYGNDDDDSWIEGEWLLWADAMRRVEGCKTIAGGRLIKARRRGGETTHDDGRRWGRWRQWTLKHDDEYHGSPHFKEQVMVLSSGGKGFKEYGHVVFQGFKERGNDNGALVA
ncbi:uncharacterized protein PG998_010454 [Apiospora kogelbergensis]|uniref:uncharacterized protein n=1 Tax=Apiospora kogelbergensis TaxID=1337665 RepID=UPI00312E040A